MFIVANTMHNLINVYVINYFLVGNMDYDVGGVYVKNCAQLLAQIQNMVARNLISPLVP